MPNTLLHIPHSSTEIPDFFWDDVVAPRDRVEADILFMCDYKTRELVEALPYEKIIAPYSRLYCDMERFRDDELESMSRIGMGAIYTHLSTGEAFRQVDPEEKERILSATYDAHHAALFDACERAVTAHGRCTIVDVHSYSDEIIARLFDDKRAMPDICIGYEKDWFNQQALQKLTRFVVSLGYSCDINTPYSGSIVPLPYYEQHDQRVQSVMLEINKRVYLHGDNIQPKAQKDIEHIINYIDSLSS